MAVLPTGIGPVTGYNIERSLRFNSADSAYLSRTPASSGSLTTWTWSAWVKLSGLGSLQVLFSAGTNGVTYHDIYINSDDTLRFVANVSGTPLKYTTQVFRDTSAWYHIVGVWDTPNATADDRMRLYVNGVRITAFSTSTNPTSSQSGLINSSSYPHAIGRRVFSSSNYFSGYLTEINFIDGQALTPSDFGETDSATGVWKPKAYSGTYGTNGFFLKFADNSGTTSTTLGKDSSGNGNNWTPNNFSVTAGAGNDSLVDSPTSYGTDTGVGGTVRGNYATFNALQLGSSTTLNNGNLDSAATASSFNTVSGTMFVSSGKWYAEVTILDVSADYSTKRVGVGIIKDTGTEQSSYLGSSTSGYAYYANATKYNNATSGSYGASYVTNDVIGIAMDLDAGTLVFYKNNTSQGTAYSGLSGAFSFAASHYGSGAKVAINFGQRAFAYTAPSGFKALCTQNLPTPTIGATSTTQADNYFDIVLRNGFGTSGGSITSVQFQPDFIWEKRRTVANHQLVDSVRGVTKYLSSNLTDAEVTLTTYFTSFNSNGYTLGAGDYGTGDALVDWIWRAGGTGVTNTAGTITSTVSANTTSGFSVVSFTSTGSQGTVGHGLGIAPSMIIMKQRSSGSAWSVYHVSIGNTKRLVLNATDAEATDSVWGNTTPTSTVFTQNVSASTPTAIAYCFAPVAGYSAFGSYTGNGSTDGPFVFTNMRPRFLLVKRTDSADDWVMYDSARDTYNQVVLDIRANSSAAEASASSDAFDFLSNGFKLRGTTYNASAGTYIYMALAENPFKYSLGR